MTLEALGFGYIVFVFIVIIRYTVIELMIQAEDLKDRRK